MSDQSEMAEGVLRRLESGPVPAADLVEEVRKRWGPEHGVSEVHGFVREVATCLLWTCQVEVGELGEGRYSAWPVEPEDADERIELELMAMDAFLVDRAIIVFRKKAELNQPSQHNAGSRPVSLVSPASASPSSRGPRG